MNSNNSNNSNTPNTPRRLPKAQAMAMALILALGGLAGGLILYAGPDNAPKAEAEAETEAAGRDEHGDHGVDQLPFTPAQIQAAQLELLQAGPGQLQARQQLPGEIRLNEDRTAHVLPRVGGVVEQVLVEQGQTVRAGQPLALIASPALAELRSQLQAAQRRLSLARTLHDREKKLWEERISAEQDYLQARQQLQEAEITRAGLQERLAALGADGGGASLNRYTLRAPFAGQVVEKHLTLGEAVKEDSSVFVIADLSRVWAEVSVPPQALPRMREGEKVQISATAFEARTEGRVIQLGALLGEQTRSAKARVLVDNPQGLWRPGLFINCEVADEARTRPLVVPQEAVHALEGRPVVFVRTASGFEARPVRTGQADGQRLEIVDGLKAGEQYAARGSFILKAELGKNSAGHEH